MMSSVLRARVKCKIQGLLPLHTKALSRVKSHFPKAAELGCTMSVHSIHKTIKKYLEKHSKLPIVCLVDLLLILFSFYLAHVTRFGLSIPAKEINHFFIALAFLIPIKLISFYIFDLYRGMWRYTSVYDFINIFKASTASTLLTVFILLYFTRFEGFSRTVFVIDLLLTIILISGFRILVRVYYEGRNKPFLQHIFLGNLFSRILCPDSHKKNLLLIGAGGWGEKMLREIRDNANLEYNVVGFLDDDPCKIGKKIHDVPILGSVDQIRSITEATGADEVLIPAPSATPEQMRHLVEHCSQSGIKFKTVPNIAELIDGNVSIRSIREVAYSDLLGRDEIRLDQENIGAYLTNRRVLVTGAGGSIGSELCRQICRYDPHTLLLFEQSENALYHLERILGHEYPHVHLVPLLADVQDKEQVDCIFARYQPNTVFHSAAYKHVPLLETQPSTVVKNNILGTLNLVQASKEYSTKRFVLVSTDKAVQPANIMGASKRMAEMLVQSQNEGAHNQTPSFVSVRFGNVIGSAGSVVPLFKRQIQNGGPVTVTHPEATRYFMLVPEACQLILQAGGMGRGGEIFILNMGQPIRIADLARDLIRISGLEPDKDIEIKYTGLRPGEKLSEKLVSEEETIVSTNHENIMVLNGKKQDFVDLEKKLRELENAAA